MTIIEEFTEFSTVEKYEETLLFLKDNNILDEFSGALQDLETLLYLSIKYGLYDIVVFLYVQKNIPYNYDLLVNMITNIPEQERDLEKVAASSGGDKRGINFSIDDKFTTRRNQCIKFLICVKKYSNLQYVRGKFMYRFNKKYTDKVIFFS